MIPAVSPEIGHDFDLPIVSLRQNKNAPGFFGNPGAFYVC
jgi:hypothetical protein